MVSPISFIWIFDRIARVTKSSFRRLLRRKGFSIYEAGSPESIQDDGKAGSLEWIP